jgi:hypothetical protein
MIVKQEKVHSSSDSGVVWRCRPWSMWHAAIRSYTSPFRQPLYIYYTAGLLLRSLANLARNWLLGPRVHGVTHQGQREEY